MASHSDNKTCDALTVKKLRCKRTCVTSEKQCYMHIKEDADVEKEHDDAYKKKDSYIAREKYINEMRKKNEPLYNERLWNDDIWSKECDSKYQDEYPCQ